MPSLLLSIDTEKAFNRVHWTYMEIVMSKFGLQGSILKAILALYSCPSAQVYSSGFLFSPFNTTNELPAIFNLMIEPLAEAIRSHNSVMGVQFGSSMHTINLFPDNVILLLLINPLTSLEQAHKILTDFRDVSYFKVNFSKSLNHKPLKTYYKENFHIHGIKKGITYLGITLTNTTSSLADANIRLLMTKLESQLKEMSKKNYHG